MKSLRPVSAAEARRLLDAAATAGVMDAEEAALEAAAGRVLASAVVAPEDLPPFARAAMDGYALRSADVAAARAGAPVSLTVIGQVVMGEPWMGSVGSGECVAIPTGGLLPEGTDAVVMVESVAEAAGAITVSGPVVSGRHVIQAGEDFRRGMGVLPAGRRLRPVDLAALAALGLTRVAVHRRPRVTVVSTGTELCSPRDVPAPGQVRDVNQYVLAAQATAAGCEVVCGGIIEDEPAALRRALGESLSRSDVVILSGGSSVGPRDHASDVLADLGPPGILFHGIDIRPGRPTLVAQAQSKLLIGMPGVPSSSIVVFEAFIRPALWRLGGETGRPVWPARRQAVLASRHASARGREDYLRVRLVEREDRLLAEPVSGGSTSLSGLLAADGLVVVPGDREGVEAGEAVTVCLLG